MSEISDMSGIQTDVSEVDPLSEADVYLAYGRHQQAEDIIRAALESAPERNELKLKLLEVFFAAKDSEAFETQAQELHDTLGDETDPMWAKVVTMGSQLCPGNPLFGGVAQALQEEQEGAVPVSDDDLLDFDFDLDSPDLGESKTKADDFDLGDEAEPSKGAEAVAPAAADNGLDFDVSSLDFSLDQRGGEAEDETPATGGDEAVVARDDDVLDFDMEMLDETVATTEATEETALEATEVVSEEESGEASLDLDLDLAESATGIEDTALEFSTDDIAPAEQSEDERVSAQQLDAELAEMEPADFNLDLSDEALSLDEHEAIEFDTQAEEKDDSELDIGLEEVAESEVMIVEESAESTETDEEPETDKDEIDVLEEELAIGDDLDDDLLGDDIFGEVDEIGTKLDLAKAYVDMGDGDGARSILDEVLEEGDDAQKQQAKDLLEQIS